MMVDGLDESYVVGKTVILVLILIVSITGNILVCYCGLHSQRMSAMNRIIVNLAVSEVLIAIVVIPVKIERELDGDIIAASPFCKLFEYLQTVALGAAVMSLIMLSIDRYCSVFHPLSKISLRQAKHMMVLTWCYPLLFASPVVYYVLGASHQPAALLLQCEQDFIQDFTQLDKLYSLIQLWLIVLLPGLAVVMVYIVIITRLLRTGSPSRVTKVGVSPKKPSNYPGPIHSSYTTALDSNIVPLAKRRAVVMNLIVMCTYLFCWAPLATLYGVTTLYDFRFDAGFQAIHDLSSFLALAKLCINPAIYSFFDSAIRDHLCRCRRRKVEPVSHGSAGQCARGKLSELNVSKIGYYHGSSSGNEAPNKEPLLRSASSAQRSYKATRFSADKLSQMIANTRRYRSMGMFTSRSSNI